MKFTRLMLPSLMAIALTGCANDPLTGEPSAATTVAKGLIGMAARGAAETGKIRKCADRAQQNGWSSREEALSSCRRKVQTREQDKRLRKAREAREEAEALHRAFNQRAEHEDTTSVVEKQVDQKSWIEQHETPPTVIRVDNALGVD